MKSAVVIDAVRTPVGRASADKGYFRDVRAEDLSANVMRAIVERTGVEKAVDRRRQMGLRSTARRTGIRRRTDCVPRR